MPLPMTRSAAERLGQRLARDGFDQAKDIELFRELLEAYQVGLLDVREQIFDRTGLMATARLKTTKSLLEKLKREPTKLPSVQDVAGLRIVVKDRVEQRTLALSTALYFDMTSSRQHRYVDRTASPRFGYRAIHVVVYALDIPVEVQFRTPLQDSWAQLAEKLGDRWGRGLRYGELPVEPDAPVNAAGFTRGAVWESVLGLSEAISILESRGDDLSLHSMLEQADPIVDPQFAGAWDAERRQFELRHASVGSFLAKLASMADSW